mmetsp:Transcript_4329/g.9338  ORF Transcript_4329/g.9338 Transcript_4329/m.9338 type:complete len:150 (+) Transcript_4329:1815-2264(+)
MESRDSISQGKLLSPFTKSFHLNSHSALPLAVIWMFVGHSSGGLNKHNVVMYEGYGSATCSSTVLTIESTHPMATIFRCECSNYSPILLHSQAIFLPLDEYFFWLLYQKPIPSSNEVLFPRVKFRPTPICEMIRLTSGFRHLHCLNLRD